MKKTTILIVMGLLCLIFKVSAQSINPVKPPKVGDLVPDMVIKDIINFKSPNGIPKTSAKLSDFKGKVLILDFWDVWCGGCLTFIPVADSLNSKLKDIALILPVTTQKKNVVLKYLVNSEFLKNYTVSSVVEDKQLSRLFPHNQIPHEVWIDTHGKVIAMTYTDYVTEKNIRLVASGASLNWIIKDDKPKPSFDSNESLLSKLNDSLLIFKSSRMIIAGHIPGYDMLQHIQVDTLAGIKKYSYVNIGLLNLYAQSITPLALNPSRTVLNVKEPKSYCFFPDSSRYGDWSALHTYSFEMYSPSILPEMNALKDITKQLESKLKIKGEQADLNVKCWVLKRVNKSKLASIYKKSTYNPVTPHLIMNYIDPEGLVYTISQNIYGKPVVDETGTHDHFDLQLKSWPRSLEEWNKQLDPFGLRLEEESRTLSMFTLSEVNN